MANYMNQVTICGRLGKDAEVVQTKAGVMIVNFSVATAIQWKDKGDWKEITTWHNVAGFNQSEHVRNGLVKGSQVVVSGRIDNKIVETEGGGKKFFSKIVADKIIVLSSPSNGSNPTEQPAEYPEYSFPDNESIANYEDLP